MNGRVVAIILAAGLSERMGEFKPLLPLGGMTVLECCTRLFRESGIEDIRVVTGHRGEGLSPLLARLGVMPVENPRYREGMFSSVRAGLATIGNDLEAFFVLPVDIPLVRPATVRRLLQSFRGEEIDVLYPAFLGERGHPPLIRARIAREIAAWNGAEGLKGALDNGGYCFRDLEVADGGILLDMDTLEEFAMLEKRAEKLDTPTVEECKSLMERVLGVRTEVVSHGRTVADVAVLLGEELNRAGYPIDIHLLEAASLLHDIAKGEPDHALVGEKILMEHGFAEIAKPVAMHMNLGKAVDINIGPAELLYLADKLVQGERRVSLEERFSSKLDRHREEPAILDGVKGRLDTARRIRDRIECILGRPLEEMLADRNEAGG